MSRKRSAIVPRVVRAASFGAVVPACVAFGLQACSNGGPVLGVAAVAYCCFEASLPDADASDAPNETSDAPNDAKLDSASDVTTEGD